MFIKNVRSMVLCALFASLITVCAWLSIPLPPVPFTLQSFGILCALGILGGKRGTAAIAVYLLLGFVGLPVFSGFRGGAGALLDSTGGFLWGFLLGGVCYRLLERLGRLPAMAGCMAVYSLCGCLWFCRYTGGSLLSGAVVCVLPFLPGDVCKLILALLLSKRLSRYAGSANTG